MFAKQITDLAQEVVGELAKAGKMIVTAESCTGGLIAGALTAIPGSSEVVYGGFVSYANAAKMAMINVPENMIAQFGAVSEQVACAIAQGALNATKVDIAIAVTGIAGPGGGTRQKPVGLVHFGLAAADKTWHMQRHFGAIGREQVRLETVHSALEMVLEALMVQP